MKEREIIRERKLKREERMKENRGERKRREPARGQGEGGGKKNCT
jgi:hypothetical protein